jgi:hypothetical protein
MKHSMTRAPIVLACVIFTACTGFLCLGCRDTINVLPSPVSTPTPTPTATPVPLNVIEFRVNGNPILAKVRFSDPVDGLTLVTTVLPYSISIQTAQTTMFLSLEATPTGYPFSVNVPVMQVQIFANGSLFREANSSDFSLNTISVSGTWRK